MASSLEVATTSIPAELCRGLVTLHHIFWLLVSPRFTLRSSCACLTKLRKAAAGILPATYSLKYLIVSESFWSCVNSLYNFFRYSSRYISGFSAALMATVKRNRVFSILSKFSSNQSPPGERNSMCPSLVLILVYLEVTPEWMALLAKLSKLPFILSSKRSASSGFWRTWSRTIFIAGLA